MFGARGLTVTYAAGPFRGEVPANTSDASAVPGEVVYSAAGGGPFAAEIPVAVLRPDRRPAFEPARRHQHPAKLNAELVVDRRDDAELDLSSSDRHLEPALVNHRIRRDRRRPGVAGSLRPELERGLLAARHHEEAEGAGPGTGQTARRNRQAGGHRRQGRQGRAIDGKVASGLLDLADELRHDPPEHRLGRRVDRGERA